MSHHEKVKRMSKTDIERVLAAHEKNQKKYYLLCSKRKTVELRYKRYEGETHRDTPGFMNLKRELRSIIISLETLQANLLGPDLLNMLYERQDELNGDLLGTVCHKNCTGRYGINPTGRVLWHCPDCLYSLKNSQVPDTSSEQSLLRPGASYERDIHDIATKRGLEVRFWYYEHSVDVLARRGGNTVGSFVLEKDLDKGLGTPTMKLKNIFVEPNFRRKHIGTLLMELAYRLASNLESGLKYWWVRTEQDEAPAAFHTQILERFGLGPVEENRVEIPFERICKIPFE
jgi:GNAT superfamily N-acetyltransferase